METNVVNLNLEFRGANRELILDRGPDTMIVGAGGTGKEQPVSETVYTPDGPVAMGDIAVGDKVLTPFGVDANVIGVYPQGVKDVYTVRFSDGSEVRCGLEHLWTVHDQQKKKHTVTTKSLMNMAGKVYIAASQPVEMTKRDVPVDPYVLGALIGDGCLRHGVVSLSSADEFIVDKVSSRLGDGYEVRHRGAYDYSIVAKDRTQLPRKPSRAKVFFHKQSGRWVVIQGRAHVGIYATEEEAWSIAVETPDLPGIRGENLKWSLESLGLMEKYSYEKRVPECYLFNDRDTRLHVLQGLMDTDGTIDPNGTQPSITTTSDGLAQDIKLLVESLGGLVTITTKKTTGRLAYNCWIRFSDPRDLFSLPRKRDRAKARKSSIVRRVVSIELTGREECQCIMIDHPDHLYLTSNFVPTHNTLAACWKIHFIAMKYPGARILMARQTLEALKSGALDTYWKHVQPERFGVITYGGSKYVPAEIRYPNGSVILVVGMDKPDKVLSTEFDVIYVNEVTELKEEAWETLRARLRNGVVPYQMIFGDLNPSGIRHWANLRMQKGHSRRLVSTHKDNPAYWNEEKQEWTELGDTYVNVTLAGLTGTRRKRFLLGEWATAEGVVYESFEADVHVRDMDTTGWRRAMGVDVGTKNPTCILTVYQRGDDDRVHVGNEFYKAGMSSRTILKAIMDEADRVKPEFIAIDPSAVAYIIDLQTAGYPAYPANNDVLVGIQRVKTVIEAVSEMPDDWDEALDGKFKPESLFSVSPMCQNLIEEFGMYAFAANHKIETDKPVKEFDHSMDALRYVCSRLIIPKIEIGFF